MQVNPSKTASEEIGKLCDGIDKSDAVGSEFFKDDSSDTLKLYHAKDVLTTSLSQLAINNLVLLKVSTVNTSLSICLALHVIIEAYLNSQKNNTDIEQHKGRIGNILNSWNFVLELVCPNWASEASPTLGCSIESLRDIYCRHVICRMSYVCRMSN